MSKFSPFEVQEQWRSRVAKENSMLAKQLGGNAKDLIENRVGGVFSPPGVAKRGGAAAGMGGRASEKTASAGGSSYPSAHRQSSVDSGLFRELEAEKHRRQVLEKEVSELRSILSASVGPKIGGEGDKDSAGNVSVLSQERRRQICNLLSDNGRAPPQPDSGEDLPLPPELASEVLSKRRAAEGKHNRRSSSVCHDSAAAFRWAKELRRDSRVGSPSPPRR